ncbi:PAS domain S-box protein [Nostoc sp. UHCC 0870]|uniref:PAS domain S-box protein n=1 Tax=Nostoc sp. UHCC 0870 TaxID=2914041 RepID=UPI001EE0D4AA|nr:PAS domain S-box protein [Nostoc sp. UHCC 0870]UKO98207.1 PAS domain S-box protein [Nostoc sp. UHCC 0870]
MINFQNIVVIIDNLSEDRSIYHRLLEQEQRYTYKIVEFASTKQALEYCKQALPDVILLGLNLSDTTGIDFLAELQQHRGNTSIPAIILSEFVDETIVVKAMKNGAQDYLIKSKITAEALNRACKTVIERFRLMQQLEQQQEQQRLIADIALRIRQSLSLESVLDTAVDEVRHLFKTDRVLVYQFQQDMSGKVVAESVLPEWNTLLNFYCQDTYLCEHGLKGYRLGKQIVVSNIYEAGYSQCHLQMLENFQVKAKVIIPIFLCNQQSELDSHCRKTNNNHSLWGLLVAHQCSSPRQWQKSEIELLEQLSVQLAIAIQQAELYENLQNLNAQLEAKVQKRTAELEKSEYKFRAIFEQTIQFVGLLTPDGTIVEMNQAYLEYVKSKRSDVIGRTFWDSFSCSDCPQLKSNLQTVVLQASQGQLISSELSLSNAEGTMTTLDFSIKPIFDETGQVILLLSEGRDITPRKQTEATLQQLNQSLEDRVQQRTLDLEQANTKLLTEISERQRVENELRQAEIALREKNALLQAIIQSAPVAISMVDAEGNLILWNPMAERIFGYSATEVLNNPIWMFVENQQQQLQSFVQNTLANRPLNQVETQINYKHSCLDISLSTALVRDAGDNLIGAMAIIEDITERKQAEVKMLQLQQRLEFLLISSPGVIYTSKATDDYGATFISENVEALFGYQPWEYITNHEFWISRIHPEDQPLVMGILEQMKIKGEIDLEYRFLDHKGNYRWVYDRARLVKDERGHPVELIGYWLDISERKKTVEQIQRSLEEKETLLKEIHHRVKNNLQIISSLLRMQSRRANDEITSMLFQESQNRVQSMALIHEQLYQSPELSQIDFGDYIRSLTDNLFRCYGVSQRQIRLNIETNGIKLTLNTAIPCGLIINELVSNCLKYAFSPQQKGEITICLEKFPENQLMLIVKDTGIGIPQTLDWQNTDSLGLRIVKNLTRQIKGKILLERESGTTFYVNFISNNL